MIIAVSKDRETVIQNDMTYSLRHVEESWIHLLKAGYNQLQCTTIMYLPYLFVW